MSGNRTYIGPFGRVLPIPEGQEAPEDILGPIDETRSTTMAMYNLPRPALDFGSDSRGFTDPLRYSSQRGAPLPAKRHERNDPPGERSRAMDSELLPSVDQLLTPATHSSVPPSMYPPNQSPKQRSSLPARQAPATKSSRSDTGQTYQGNYQPLHHAPVPQLAQKFTARRDSHTAGFPPSLQHPPLLQAYVSTTSNLASNSAYLAPTHQVHSVRQGQSQTMAPTGHPLPVQQQQNSSPGGTPSFQQSFHSTSLVQYYVDDPGPSNVSTNSAGSPEQSDKSPDNAVKLQPRVLREEILAGEGPVWVYEDGSTCPKVIDGEPVKAEWGVTKAGKPRKRLAIACTTCREKKIRCQPSLPKCAQCEKFGRECRYATAPRIQHFTPETPSYKFQAHNKPMTIKTEPHNQVLLPSTVKPKIHDEHFLAKRRDMSSESNEAKPTRHQVIWKQSKKPPHKKPRPDHPPPVPKLDMGATPIRKSREDSTSSAVIKACEENPSKSPRARYEWSTNPYEVDAKAVSHYVEMYFVHINAARHRLFPHWSFVRWLENNDEKSPDDMMLIYAMLTLGSIFSAGRDYKADGHLFVKVARSAVEQSQHKYSLQLVQSRLILGLYYFAIGEMPGGWDFIGQGLRVAQGLNLNTEEHFRDAGLREQQPFGLYSDAVDECCRRTYWSAYIIDRCTLLRSGKVPMLQSQDCFLRLPCDEDTYNRQKASNAPYFNDDLYGADKSPWQHDTALGPMAYLVNISAIWGDVSTFTYRHAREPAGKYASNYEKHYREIIRRLSDWKTSLPEDLAYTPSNAFLSIENGRIGLFLDIHALYHTVIMKLNRVFRHSVISPLSGSRNFNKARKQAFELLQMIEVVVAASRSSKNTLDFSGNLPDFPDEALESCSPLAGSSHMMGYAVLLAIDILSAGGSTNPEPFKKLTCSMSAGLAIVDELSQCWTSAIRQQGVILRRLESLCGGVANEVAGVKRVWRHRVALDTVLQSGQDLFYNDIKNARDTFFDHLEIDVAEDQALYID